MYSSRILHLLEFLIIDTVQLMQVDQTTGSTLRLEERKDEKRL
jgi:hypothetical protein